MEQAPATNSREHLSDEELARSIKEISQKLFDITDSPTRGMAEMEIGRDPDSNATETAAEQGQFIPGEENTDANLRAQLRELELERDRRHKAAA